MLCALIVGGYRNYLYFPVVIERFQVLEEIQLLLSLFLYICLSKQMIGFV